MTEQKQKRGCCGDVCAVFIHGFMGSPAQFSRLAEVARAAGSQSRLITLPGHGGCVREFMRAGRSAWLAHVETELADLRAQHEKLLLVGHSMGGLLAINAAAKQPEGIAGILALALPLYLRATANGLRIRVHSVLPARPEEDPRVCAARELRGVQGVTLWNAPALVPNSLGLLRLMAQTRKALPNLAVPLNVINSAEDEIVSRRSLAFVRERLAKASVFEQRESSHFWYSEYDKTELEQHLVQALQSAAAQGGSSNAEVRHFAQTPDIAFPER